MDEIAVKIERYPDGRVMVGVIPAEAAPEAMPAEEQAEASQMQQVGSVDEALAMAKQMLEGGESQQPNAEIDLAEGFGKGAPVSMPGRM